MVKLSVPSGPGIRFIVGRPTRAVVTGIFPPEHPDVVALRIAVAASLADHQPAIDAALDRAQKAFEHEIIYGKPGGVEPRGILSASPRGFPWIEPKKERAASDLLERLGIVVRPRYDGITLT